MSEAGKLPFGLQLTDADPEYRADPHARLDMLREKCPVMRDPMFGAFFVTRFDDARTVLTDRTMWRTSERAEPDAVMVHASVRNEPPELRQADGLRGIIFMEAPEHARVRTPLQKALYARVAKCRTDVERVVGQCLDAIADKDTVDLMQEFCIPVPVKVISHVLGVSDTRYREFHEWSEGLLLTFNPARTPEQTAQFVQATLALREFFDAEIADRRKTPRDDLISDILDAREHGTQLSDHEIRDNLIGFLVAGNMTTTDLIGNGIHLLLKHPGQLAKMSANPDLISHAVEEVLRYEPPVDVTVRVASRDMELQGCPIRQSQAMTFSLPAANRDPRVFERADVFDIEREAKPHMSFGGGAHICIGAPLARMEAQVAFRMLFERYPNMQLLDDRPVWKQGMFFHGMEQVRVKLR